MPTKKEYINLIRWSCFIESFTTHYFIKIIIIYLLAQNVTPWVAVSIPLVFEFACMISRALPNVVNFAININYKKYHIFHIVIFCILGFAMTFLRDVYSIYAITIILGLLTGIKHATVTKLSIQNKKFESDCLMEQEKSIVIGAALGLIISQFVFDLNPMLYVTGFIVLLVLGTIVSFVLNNIKVIENPKFNKELKPLDKESKKQVTTATILFGILVGFWCMALGAFNELVPLITTKLGYLQSVYLIIEFVIILFVSGKLLNRIKKNNKLFLSETIVALVDVICLLIIAFTLSWQGVLIAYILMSITSTLGDPLWGSIMSSFAADSEEKWIKINRVYFITRSIFTLITLYICREIVIHGIEGFKYLGIALFFLIIIMYFVCNIYNKKVFGKTI